MKKLFWTTIVFLCLSMALLVGCTDQKEQLAAPQNVRLDESCVLRWDAVEGAEKYIVDVAGRNFTVEDVSCDLFDSLLESKTYEASVSAIGKDGALSQATTCEVVSNVVSASALAATSSDGGKTCFVRISSEAKANACGKLVIPTELDGALVTGISASGFANCDKITSVYVPDTVNVVGTYAFANCTSLRRADLSDNIEKLSSVFINCEQLFSVKLPKKLIEMGAACFQNCVALKSLVFPNTMTTLKGGAFSGVSSLEQLAIQDGENDKYFCNGSCIVEKSTGELVVGCISCVIPSNVKKIGNGAFYGRGIAEVVLPSGVEEVCFNAFRSCEKLSSVVFPESLSIIGNGAFSGCGSLVSLSIPSAKSVADNAFLSCSSLESVVFGEGLESLGKARPSFEDCVALKEVVLPSSLKFLSPGSFCECSLLKNLVVPENTGYEIANGCIVKGETLVSAFSFEGFPESVSEIGKYAFYKTDLREVSVPSKVKKLGESSFSESRLQHVVLCGVEEIADNAFLSGADLVSIQLPACLRRIGAGAFGDCMDVCVTFAPGTGEVECYAKESHPNFYSMYVSSGTTFNYVVDPASGAVASDRASIFGECEMAGEEGAYYVKAFTLYYGSAAGDYVDENGTFHLSQYLKTSICLEGLAVAPYRKGYAFLGWTMQEDGTEPEFPSEAHTFVRTSDLPSGSTPTPYTRTYCLDRKVIDSPWYEHEEGQLTIPDGSVLYAVWQKID